MNAGMYKELRTSIGLAQTSVRESECACLPGQRMGYRAALSPSRVAGPRLTRLIAPPCTHAARTAAALEARCRIYARRHNTQVHAYIGGEHTRKTRLQSASYLLLQYPDALWKSVFSAGAFTVVSAIHGML